ncbi:MAG: DUF2167 domain-containing protein [Kofleriaceae bacterium]
MSRRWGVVTMLVLAMAGTAVAEKAKADKPAKSAKAAPAPAPAAPPAEAEAPEEAAAPEEPGMPHIKGPQRVELGHRIEIDVPEGAVLFEREQARQLLRMDAPGDNFDDVLGMVIRPDKNWLVVIEYDDIGHVSDDDADHLDADELLESYRRATSQQNAKRREHGISELFVDGWSERPRYDRAARHLVWGLRAHSVEGPVINFFTRILGRGGVASLNLVDDASVIEQSKAEAQDVLSAVRFKEGARYEDFREGDRSSGIGLRGLVLGGAGIATVKAAKAGIFVTLLVALKKGFAFILVGIAGLFKWMFGRKKRPEVAEATKIAEATGPNAPSDWPPT